MTTEAAQWKSLLFSTSSKDIALYYFGEFLLRNGEELARARAYISIIILLTDTWIILFVEPILLACEKDKVKDKNKLNRRVLKNIGPSTSCHRLAHKYTNNAMSTVDANCD